MENTSIITNYAGILEVARKSNLPLFVLLDLGNYPSLMSEVISSYAKEAAGRFKLIKIQGVAAKNIQAELNVLNLPALIIFKQEKIKAIYQGLIAQYELQEILSKL